MRFNIYFPFTILFLILSPICISFIAIFFVSSTSTNVFPGKQTAQIGQATIFTKGPPNLQAIQITKIAISNPIFS